MPVILDEINVSEPVALKVKRAMEQRVGEVLTPAEAKTEFRKMVMSLIRHDVVSHLRDRARKENMPDVVDVESEFLP